jgi:hypothetical protein
MVLAAACIVGVLAPDLPVVRALGSVFDGRWYLTIAQHGYPHRLFQEGGGSRWAFFPAFPVAIRALALVTGLGLTDAAVVAAFGFGLTSALAIWLAVREVCGPTLADRAVLLYVFCPSAYVLSLAYTEGLFLTAAALCLFALSRRWWVTAGLCACLAGLTRNAGAVVVLAVLVTAVPAAWRGRSLRPALGATVAPLGLVSFMAYGWSMVGTPIAFVASERFWDGQHFVWFTTPVLAALAAVGHVPWGTTWVTEAMAGGALVIGFAGAWWLDRMRARPLAAGEVGSFTIPPSWWVYTVGVLLVAFSADASDSIPRYAMAAFPLFAAFAWKLSTPRRTWTVVGAMALVQVALMTELLCAVVHPVHHPLVP